MRESGRAEVLKPGERARRLKEKTQIKSLCIEGFVPNEMFSSPCIPVQKYKEGTRVCTERARLYTESFKATEGEPMIIRRAKAFSHILENMTVYILDDELIVGNFASDPACLPIYPEQGQQWMEPLLDNEFAHMMDDAVREECGRLLEFWRGKGATEQVMAALPADLRDYVNWNGLCCTFVGSWRTMQLLDYKKMLTLGIDGVTGQVRERLASLDADAEDLSTGDYIDAKRTLNAMLISLEAAARFIKRYAARARQLAGTERNGRRKKELKRIAEVCDRVSLKPARTLHEAVQACFFLNLISKQILFHGQGWGARMDVLLNPYYQEDIGEGRITREGAQELMECLLIKLSARGHLLHPNRVGAAPGNSDWINLTIGGISPDGDDVTNDFSFIILDAVMNARVPEPTIALRYSPKTPDELLSKVIDVIRTGIGYPAVFNDSAIIPWLVDLGVTEATARDYGIMSCVNPQVQAANTRYCFPHIGSWSAAKCLELALYRGKDKDVFTGRQLGEQTPDPVTFTSFQEMLDAYLSQVRFTAKKLVRISHFAMKIAREQLQQPFTAAFINGCIEEGKDCTELGKTVFTTALPMGTTNVADSLAAIKKFVFDDEEITMSELIDACRTSFDGREKLRQKLINEAPKFGNDDDYVDEIAREVHVRTNGEFRNLKDYWGCPVVLNGSVAGGYYGLSKACGATPDGRRDGESCADGAISPMAGRDTKGPTAVLNSVGKIPVTYNHLLNQRFLPVFLEGNNKKLFVQYLRTWGELGIHHIQFIVVSTDTLRDAQAHPENYKDLIVRVAGYSAFFVDLSKGIQDDIIQRTEQSFV
jgi:pyruvate formate-lyase/glycerol dehydratase family glycyl radical enzyme